MSTEGIKTISPEEFEELIIQAKKGNTTKLNQFLQELYQKGKVSLLSLTKSEVDAEEYFAIAVAKFWQKFVIGDQSLPKTNIEGYIYTMAKFLCLDQKRSTTRLKIVADGDKALQERKEFSEEIKTTMELMEEENAYDRKKEAMKRGIARLGDKCQNLFKTIMEKGVEKPSQLFVMLGLENARAVTVLRYECTRQLRKKAALELELLMSQEITQN